MILLVLAVVALAIADAVYHAQRIAAETPPDVPAE